SSWYCRGWLVCPFLSFFSCYAAPRDLHSFPTRRSSDLAFRLALDGGVPSMPLGALRHAFGDEDLTATATPLGPRFMLYVERPAEEESASERRIDILPLTRWGGIDAALDAAFAAALGRSVRDMVLEHA